MLRFSQSARKSFVGRVNYSHKDKYLFSATMRADATARYSVEVDGDIFQALVLDGEYLKKIL